MVREGEAILRSRLAVLSLDQLRDIVAEHGLDPGRLEPVSRITGLVLAKIDKQSKVAEKSFQSGCQRLLSSHRNIRIGRPASYRTVRVG